MPILQITGKWPEDKFLDARFGIYLRINKTAFQCFDKR
jgi:hypothetical protein